MRPVLARRRPLFGFFPASQLGAEPIPPNLEAVLNASVNYEDIPLVTTPTESYLILDNPQGAFGQAESYADFLRLAVRLLGEAKQEALKTIPKDGTPAMAEKMQGIATKVRDSTLKLLKNFEPGGEMVSALTTPDPSVPDGTVSYNMLLRLTGNSGIGDLLDGPFGKLTPKAKTAQEMLRRKVKEVGVQTGILTSDGKSIGSRGSSAVAPGESFTDAASRWTLQDRSRAAAAPAPLTALTRVAPAESAAPPPVAEPVASTTAAASLPSWALPVAAGVAGILGLALLFWPAGSANEATCRGACARGSRCARPEGHAGAHRA